MTKIIIDHDVSADEYSVRVKSSDAEGFAYTIASLKRIISVSHRRYEPSEKRWIIKAEGDAELSAWLTSCRRVIQADVEFTKQDAPPPPPPPKPRKPSQVDCFATLHLLPSAPTELVKQAYRVLAVLNHPDKGGDERMMQTINAAYAALERR